MWCPASAGPCPVQLFERLEPLAGVGDIPGGDHRARDPRAPHGPARIGDARPEDRVDIERHAVRAETPHDLVDAIDPPPPLLGEELLKRDRIAIEEISENVNV